MKKQLELLPTLVRELAQMLPDTEGLASALHSKDFLEAERKYAEQLEEDIKHLTDVLCDYGGFGPGTPPAVLLERANRALGLTWKGIHRRRAERKKYDEADSST